MKTKLHIFTLMVVLAALIAPAMGYERVRRDEADPITGGATAEQLGAEMKPKDGAVLPLDLEFTDHTGAKVRLKDYFTDRRPVVLTMVYHTCPQLCGMAQEGLMNGIKSGPRELKVGKDYRVLVISFDHDEETSRAALIRKNYLGRMGLPENQEGFVYLTGTQENIRAVANTIGFGFKFNPAWKNDNSLDKYIHQAGIFIFNGDGKLAQAIGGVMFEEDLMHYQLLQAGEGKVGSGMLRLALNCGLMYVDEFGNYRHNPWAWAGTIGGAVILLCVGSMLAVLWRGEFRKKHETSVETQTSN